MAFEAASRTSCAISAPTNPCIVHAVSRIISSVKSCLIVPKCDFKISNLCCGSGAFTSSSRSNLPGRLSPTSTASGLFVVAKTTMPSRLTTLPSKISVNAATARVFKCDSSPPSPELPPEFWTFSPLEGQSASSSSIKTIAGFAFAAARKTSRMASSVSPTTEPTSSGPSTTKSVAFDVSAACRAKSVLPVPGGPQSKAPRGGATPHFLKRSALTSGSVTISFNATMCDSHPASTFLVLLLLREDDDSDLIEAPAARARKTALPIWSSSSSSSSSLLLFLPSWFFALVSLSFASRPSSSHVSVSSSISPISSLLTNAFIFSSPVVVIEITSNNAETPKSGKRTICPTRYPRSRSARKANISNDDKSFLVVRRFLASESRNHAPSARTANAASMAYNFNVTFFTFLKPPLVAFRTHTSASAGGHPSESHSLLDNDTCDFSKAECTADFPGTANRPSQASLTASSGAATSKSSIAPATCLTSKAFHSPPRNRSRTTSSSSAKTHGRCIAGPL
mmetsp:Transcript_6488/g.21673  ORF Transcript_6488/g.21673 Transcript_6488/m.21673 type:complete len:510 (-) Transcript_6488:737-2266(-)